MTPSAGTLQPALAAAACVDSWQPVTFPTQLAALQPIGVATLSGQPAWVVGGAAAVAEETQVPLIGKWTNGSWTKVTAPWVTFGVLNAVAASNATNAWAVGALGMDSRTAIATHWNGTVWSKVAVPQPTGRLAVFSDLALVTDARFWAVGAYLLNGRLKPLAMLQRSAGWLTLSPSVGASGEGGLTAVTLAPGGRLWAGGWRTNNSGQGRPWVIYRTASGWVTSTLGVIGSGRASVTDLSFRTANDGWAAGYIDAGHGYTPFLQHWNGVSWEQVSLPWSAGRSIVLNAVEQDSAGRLIVAGTEIGAVRRDILAVRNSLGWVVTSLSAGNTGLSLMTGTARLSSGAMAVGYYDGQPVTMLPCQATSSAPGRGPGPSSNVVDETDEDTVRGPLPPDDAAAVQPRTLADTVAVDMTSAAGLQISAFTYGGVAADFNGDGHPDVFINRHNKDIPLLMLNNGAGAFSSLDGGFARRDRHRCAAADVDRDGAIDLFCTIGVNKGTSNTPDELTLDIGEAGGTWASDQYGVMDGYGRGRDATFLNLDGDAYPDLYVVNEASRSDAMSSSDRLFRNANGAGFNSSPAWGVDHSMGGACTTAGDLNGDKLDELLLCAQETIGGLSRGIRVFVNTAGKFVDRTTALGLAPIADNDAELADFNGDGRLDIAQLSAQLLRVSLATDGTFAKAFELPLTHAVAMATGDVNGDGRPDIYIARATSGNAGHLMLVNGGDGTSFTSITIPQPGAGSADDVMAIDYDGNGRTDFITLNGWNVVGPLKLTAFFPPS